MPHFVQVRNFHPYFLLLVLVPYFRWLAFHRPRIQQFHPLLPALIFDYLLTTEVLLPFKLLSNSNLFSTLFLYLFCDKTLIGYERLTVNPKLLLDLFRCHPMKENSEYNQAKGTTEGYWQNLGNCNQGRWWPHRIGDMAASDAKARTKHTKKPMENSIGPPKKICAIITHNLFVWQWHLECEIFVLGQWQHDSDEVDSPVNEKL